MSKFILGSIAAGLIGGALYGAATRRTSTRGNIVPVDDEINIEPFTVDAARAHELKLDQDAALRRRSNVSVKREGDIVIRRDARDVALTEVPVDPKRLKQAEYEHIIANEKRLEAEEIAAKASGAVAAATSLRDKEAMDEERREALKQRLADLKAAEDAIKNELRDVTSLVRKDSRTLKDAEQEASKLLDKQENLMVEAARHENIAVDLEHQLEEERYRILERRKAEAERRAKLLETQKETEANRAAREAEIAAETRRRLQEEMDLARQQESVRAALANQRAEAERKRREAEEALKASRALLLEAESQKKDADAKASSVGKPEDIDRRLRELNREIELHSQRSLEAKNALANLENERDRALLEASESESIASRFKSWWGGGEKPSIVATSDATGQAVSRDVVVEKERLLHRGTKTETVPGVEASGRASVGFEVRPPHVPGEEHNLIERSSLDERRVSVDKGPGRGEARSAVEVREGSRVLK